MTKVWTRRQRLDDARSRVFRQSFLVGQLAVAALWIAGCSSTPDGAQRTAAIHPPLPTVSQLDQYAEAPGPGLECVPYARTQSGIGIFGDAYRWWDIAEDYFMRGNQPIPGSVLVLARTDRLRYGHLAVVSEVLGRREILVDHANWVPGRIIIGMPVVDVSAGNDWTLLRFWNNDSAAFGAAYPADGFIYNPATIAGISLSARSILSQLGLLPGA